MRHISAHYGHGAAIALFSLMQFQAPLMVELRTEIRRRSGIFHPSRRRDIRSCYR